MFLKIGYHVGAHMKPKDIYDRQYTWGESKHLDFWGDTDVLHEKGLEKTLSIILYLKAVLFKT